jgi:hypothetical protein
MEGISHIGNTKLTKIVIIASLSGVVVDKKTETLDIDLNQE